MRENWKNDCAPRQRARGAQSTSLLKAYSLATWMLANRNALC
jgi:hypothetical protein